MIAEKILIVQFNCPIDQLVIFLRAHVTHLDC